MNLDSIEATDRWHRAAFPGWTQAFMDGDGYLSILNVMNNATPPTTITGWEKAVADGKIVDSSSLNHRGRGLWLLGGKNAAAVAAVLLQRLLLLDHVKTGLFFTEAQLLESESPNGERNYTPRNVELLALIGVGTAYRAASGWADSVVSSLLHDRMLDGMPTLVTSERQPLDCGLTQLFVRESFYIVDLNGGGSAEG